MSSKKQGGIYGHIESAKSGRWDMEEMEKRAKEREAKEDEQRKEDAARALGKTVKKSSDKPAPRPEDVEAAKYEKLNLESAVGKVQVVQTGPDGRTPGFHCKVCDCILKDSQAYMDHVNGKKHLKNLGVSRKAVRENVSDVVAKMQQLKRKAEKPTEKYDLDSRVEAAQREEERERAEKRERKKQKKMEKKGKDEKEDDDGFGGMDPAMAAMMGFGGFGSSKK
ncbi:zinc finger, matrin-type 2 [Actinomortierella ambigua]|nr:zinc finger, matrin-type 2 [Actinomortierella ambigua]